MESFGSLLKKFRFAAGLSQRQLAKVIGISPSHLSRIETGNKKPPKRVTVQKIAAALGLSNEQQENWFEAAGYSWIPKMPTIAFGSPLRLEEPAPNIALITKINGLDLASKNAVDSIIFLLLSEELSAGERLSVANHIISFSNGLRDILLQLHSGQKGSNKQDSNDS